MDTALPLYSPCTILESEPFQTQERQDDLNNNFRVILKAWGMR